MISVDPSINVLVFVFVIEPEERNYRHSGIRRWPNVRRPWLWSPDPSARHQLCRLRLDTRLLSIRGFIRSHQPSNFYRHNSLECCSSGGEEGDDQGCPWIKLCWTLAGKLRYGPALPNGHHLSRRPLIPDCSHPLRAVHDERGVHLKL